MRAGAALVALTLLSACGVVGPSQADLDAAVRDFYAHPGNVEISATVQALQESPIADFEGCQPLRGTFRCALGFTTPEGRVSAIVWTERRPEGGWRVQNIALNERPS